MDCICAVFMSLRVRNWTYFFVSMYAILSMLIINRLNIMNPRRYNDMLKNKPPVFIMSGLAFYWLIFLHIGWENTGGWGTDLPYNLLGWGTILLLCSLTLGLSANNFYTRFGKTGKILIAGAVLMTLPILWSPTYATIINAIPRLLGMWGGVLFWGTLRQCRFSMRQRVWLLYCLAGAGIIEAIIVLLELYVHPVWLPVIWQVIIAQYGRYAAGVFQQINLTASFLATGLAAVLLLIGLRKSRLNSDLLEKLRIVVLAVSCVVISTVLTISSSRTGWLSSLGVIVGVYYLLAFSRFNRQGHQQQLLLALPLIGIMTGLAVMPYSAHHALTLHHGSNQQRLITLYYTFLYSIQHPYIGYGAGTFEGLYQNFLAQQPGGNPGHEIMSHPHNELLYQYAEGGLIALAGVLLWLSVVVHVWLKAESVFYRGVVICMLPIVLHTQVEYPLYYSVPHFLALLMLLSLAEENESSESGTSKASFSWVHILMLVLTLYGAIVSFQSYRVWNTLEKFESSSLTNPDMIKELNVPWVMRLHYEQDLTLLHLFQFRHNKDPNYLKMFVQENENWISVHAWPVLYQNQISVLRYMKDMNNLLVWQERAKRTFSWDKRFLFKAPQKQKNVVHK